MFGQESHYPLLNLKSPPYLDPIKELFKIILPLLSENTYSAWEDMFYLAFVQY